MARCPPLTLTGAIFLTTWLLDCWWSGRRPASRSEPGSARPRRACGGPPHVPTEERRRDPKQRALEAGGVARGEQLLGIRPRPARAAHLTRNIESDIHTAVARPRMPRTATHGRRLGGVEDLESVVHVRPFVRPRDSGAAAFQSQRVARAAASSASPGSIRLASRPAQWWQREPTSAIRPSASRQATAATLVVRGGREARPHRGGRWPA